MQDLDVAARIFRACGALSSRDRVDTVSLAWLAIARDVRAETLSVPGGFPEERRRQAAELRKMADLVDADAPDLELERLFHEGAVTDIEAYLKKVRGRDDGPST